MGVDFSHLRGASGGPRIKKLFEKKVKALLHVKIVSKLFCKVISPLYNCSKRIKTVCLLMRGP